MEATAVSPRRLLGAMVALCATVVLGLTLVSPAMATFPGLNGKISFEQNGGGMFNLVKTISPDGTGLLTVIQGGEPEYSPDGSRLIYQDGEGIAIVNPDGSGARSVRPSTNDIDKVVTYKNVEVEPSVTRLLMITEWERNWDNFWDAAFLPDGVTLAGLRDTGRESGTEYCAVITINDDSCIPIGQPGHWTDAIFNPVERAQRFVKIAISDGSVIGDLTPVLSGSVEDVGVSVDGRIAFSYKGPGDAGLSLYTVAPGGGVPVKVAGTPAEIREPNFSPDGARIVYEHDAGLEIVATAGGTPQKITIPLSPLADDQTASSPVFSPDGTKIAFEYYLAKEGTAIENSISLINPDGTGLTRVIESAAEPSWQPVIPPTPVVPKGAVATAKKKVKLNGKGKATIGKIVCGDSPCGLKVQTAKLKIGKKKWTVKITMAKKLAAGKSGKVKLTVSGKALAALKTAGKGRLTAKVQVRDAAGATSFPFKPSVKPAPPKKKRAK